MTLFLFDKGLDTCTDYFSVKEALESGIEIRQSEPVEIPSTSATCVELTNTTSNSSSSSAIAVGVHGEIDSPITPSCERVKYTKRTKDLRSGTEILLEKQVNLFEQQLDVMKDIRTALHKRNQLEEEKIAMKRARLD